MHNKPLMCCTSFVNGNVASEIKSSRVICLNVSKTHRETFMEPSLLVAGTLLWNSLLGNLRSEND